MAVHAENELEEKVIWYMDTGCSNDMTGSKTSFTDLKKNFQSTVSFGDLSTVNVMGIGNINFRTKNKCVEIISNVFYVLALKINLLSAGECLEKRYIITLRNDKCEIPDPSRRVIAFVKMCQNRLFPLKIENVQSCYMAEVKNSSW